MSTNKITELDETVFLDVKSLSSVDFSYNELKSLPKAIFSRSGGFLYSIDLSGNQLSVLSDQFFSNLTWLGKLQLSNNSLSYLPDVSAAIYLNEVDLSLNRFKSIPPSVKSLQSLRSFYFSSNLLSEIKSSDFNSLSLWTLDLSRNAITNLPEDFLKQISNILKLDLSKNSIQALPGQFFKNLDSIQEINLADNKISNIPESAFLGIKSLKLLDLQNNKLVSLPNWMLDYQNRGFTLMYSLSDPIPDTNAPPAVTAAPREEDWVSRYLPIVGYASAGLFALGFTIFIVKKTAQATKI
jgi:Leucine-rich repeat (LRR) protein